MHNFHSLTFQSSQKLLFLPKQSSFVCVCVFEITRKRGLWITKIALEAFHHHHWVSHEFLPYSEIMKKGMCVCVCVKREADEEKFISFHLLWEWEENLQLCRKLAKRREHYRRHIYKYSTYVCAPTIQFHSSHLFLYRNSSLLDFFNFES